jgi:aryl-alcohol dehydrogenase-like predicted oxidoreductase
MQKRECGKSGLKLSVLGIGCWSFGGGEADYWGPQDQKDAQEVVHKAVDLGVNYFDTAEAYNSGRSETGLGDAIRGISRDSVVIGTKLAPSNAFPGLVTEHCEASLKRLDTDYIDLYMVHWPLTLKGIQQFDRTITIPPATDEVFAELGKLQDQGKIRHIGVSNFGCRRLDEALRTGAVIAVNQLPYSLVSRAIEWKILPACAERGVGVVGYMALQQGLLSDRYTSIDQLPPLRSRTRHFDNRRISLARHGENGAENELAKALLEIHSLARELGTTVSKLALAWCVGRPAVTCTLAGARNARQLEENAQAFASPLADDIIRRLDDITGPLKEKMGPSFDYWESEANDRTV